MEHHMISCCDSLRINISNVSLRYIEARVCVFRLQSGAHFTFKREISILIYMLNFLERVPCNKILVRKNRIGVIAKLIMKYKNYVLDSVKRFHLTK